MAQVSAGRAFVRATASLIAIAAFVLLSVAPAFADPGAPGLDQPSTAVYERTEDRTAIGGEPGAGDGDEEGDGLPAGIIASGGGGDGGGAAGGDEALPFTGFAAALVLGAGLAALLLGFALRAGLRRPRRA